MKMSDFAHALGISLNQAYRLKRVGMPTHDVESARRWRAANLDPARVHGGRIDRPLTVNQPPPPEPLPRAADDLDHIALWIALRFTPENMSKSVACWVNNGDYPDRLREDLTALLTTVRDCLNRLNSPSEPEDDSCRLSGEALL